MKKFLSLVLALVMTMSLVTMAGAKDFTDKADIDHAEAVEVMEAVKVITGYTDGSFRPDTLLNRGQAAKIICNLILGPTEAAALSTASAPFSDVPANHVFAGYIAYCASEGIINGYTDGTFRPANTLNGYAFMKMLLGVLGYDGAIENYSGNNWSINVAKQGLAIGLNSGIEGFTGSQAISRQVACQMALNALEADWVDYADKGANITIGGVVINTGASAAVEQAPYYDKLFDGDLVKSYGVDAATGRPSTTWTYDGDAVGTYADKPVATYYKAVKEKDVYKDASIDKAAFYDFVLTENKATAPSTGNYQIDKNDSTVVPQTGDGIVTEFYLNKDENRGYMVTTHPVIGKISSVSKNADGDRIVYVNGKSFETEDFAKGDYVIYTCKSDSGWVIADMVKVEKQTGTVTLLKGADEVYIDNVKYIKSDSTGADLDTVAVKDVVDFWLDAQGNLLKLAVSEANVNLDNIAFVEKAGASTDTYASSFKADLRYADGSKKTVTTDINYNVYAGNNIATFKLNSDDKTELKDNNMFYYGTGINLVKGNPTTGTVANGEGSAAKVTTSNTKFVYVLTNGSKTEVNVYEGYKNAPSINSANVAVYAKEGKALLVYVYGAKGNLQNSMTDLTYLVYNKDAKFVDDGDSALYYEIPSIVAGKIGTTKVRAADWSIVDDNEVQAFNSAVADADGIVTTGSAMGAPAYDITGTVKAVDGETITIGGATKAWADDVKVFFVNKDLVIREGTIDDIYEGTVGTNNYDSYAGGVYTVDTTDAHVIECIILCEK